MRRTLLAATFVALLLLPAPRAAAWGFEAHKFIADQAIALLPPELRRLFERERTMFVEHAIDPDLWRNVGFTDEPPRHFLDLDAYGEYPFDALPRDFDEAVRVHGEDKVRRNGQLPWRVEDIYGRLLRAFQQVKEGDAPPWTFDNIVYFSSVLAHYVGDAHVPFHAVVNYDGQVTNQLGIHARFETELFRRTRDALRIRPVQRAPITTPRDTMFDVLLVSTTLAGGILDADRQAIGSKEYYDDEYFDAFARGGAQAVLERRVNDAIAAVAAIITGAWEEAGRPSLDPPDGPRKPQKRRYVKSGTGG
jgi:hypothetical protein